MGCCQSEGLGANQHQQDFKTEIVGYEKREENNQIAQPNQHSTKLSDYLSYIYSQLGYVSNPNGGGYTANGAMFEDNFYIDSVERYNVKYKPPAAGAGNGPSNNKAAANNKQAKSKVNLRWECGSIFQFRRHSKQRRWRSNTFDHPQYAARYQFHINGSAD